MAFIVKKDITAGMIISTIKKVGGKLLSNVQVFDVYTGEGIGEDEKSLAFSLDFIDNKRTLTEDEVMDLFNKIIVEVEKKYKAVLRDK